MIARRDVKTINKNFKIYNSKLKEKEEKEQKTKTMVISRTEKSNRIWVEKMEMDQQ